MQADDEIVSYRDQNRATARFVLWTLAWVATLAFARFGPELMWDSQRQPMASWAAVAVNFLTGIAWIIAFAAFLRALDDLWRKIMLDALAVSLGVGWVVGFAYVVADGADLITYKFDIALFPVLLGVVYSIAIVVGRLRYR